MQAAPTDEPDPSGAMVKVVAPVTVPMANPRESLPSAVRLIGVPDAVVDELGVNARLVAIRCYPSTSTLVIPAVVRGSVSPGLAKALNESGVGDA